MTPAPGLSPACLLVSPSLVTLAPGSCLPLVSLVSHILSPGLFFPVSPSLRGQMPDAVTPAPGLSPCVSQSLRSDARCCDAGSRIVSPACLPVSPSVVTDVGSKLVPRLSACVFQSPRSDARCCDAGSRVVYPACLPVSQML